MVQTILLGIVFLVALAYLGRFIYRQVHTGNREGHCEKCLKNEQSQSEGKLKSP